MRDTYAILGFGVSGRSVLRYLLSHGVIPTVYETAARCGAIRREHPDIPVCDDWDGIREQVLFRSPGVRPDYAGIPAAVRRGAVLTAECERFAEQCPAPLYLVTGSDGKTTTATLAARMLDTGVGRVWLGGNIGTPLLDRLGDIRPDDRVVMELSSFQLMTFQPRSRAAVVTNLTENHLDWHRDMAEYRRAKQNVLTAAAIRVQNARSPVAPALTSLTFSCRDEGANFHCANGCFLRGDTVLCREDEWKLPGEYNRENLLAAAALTGADSADVVRAVRDFTGVEHRMQEVGTFRGVRCFDSSIDTTPARTAAALSACPPPLTVICGGRNKNLSFSPLNAALIRYADRVIFTGECGEEMRRALREDPAYGGCPQTVYVSDFSSAVLAGLSLTPQGGSLLLSPAAASFDAFSSYRERGDAFCALLRGGGGAAPNGGPAL